MTVAANIGSQPLISVAITLYNREQFISDSLQSVRNQTWKNLEILVVDDCSTDGSHAVVQRYLEDPRIRFIRNEANLGDYANRNYAATLARGELLKFHDSDDVMYPDCIRTMAEPLLSEERANVALTTSRSWEGGPVPMLLTPELAFEREFLGIGLFSGGPANALFKTRDFLDFGGFTDIGPASDHLFWMHYFAVNSVLLVNADLFFWRRHEGQEIAGSRAGASYARLHGLVWRFLAEGRAPLKGAKLDQAKSNWLWIIAKTNFNDLKAGRLDLIRTRLAAADISPADWARYFRRPSRSLDAGTPQAERRAPS